MTPAIFLNGFIMITPFPPIIILGCLSFSASILPVFVYNSEADLLSNHCTTGTVALGCRYPGISIPDSGPANNPFMLHLC
jgi:hypothetical protein